jgi:hypothetical protein
MTTPQDSPRGGSLRATRRQPLQRACRGYALFEKADLPGEDEEAFRLCAGQRIGPSD